MNNNKFFIHLRQLMKSINAMHFFNPTLTPSQLGKEHFFGFTSFLDLFLPRDHTNVLCLVCVANEPVGLVYNSSIFFPSKKYGIIKVSLTKELTIPWGKNRVPIKYVSRQLTEVTPATLSQLNHCQLVLDLTQSIDMHTNFEDVFNYNTGEIE